MTLQQAFDKECETQKKNDKSITDEMLKTFNYLHDHLFALPFKECVVEITSMKKIKITLSFLRDKILMITKSYEVNQVEGFGDRITYSLFFEKTHQISDMMNLKEFASKFKNYIES